MDIYLQELMNGRIQQKDNVTKNSNKRTKNRFEIEIDKEIEAHISSLSFDEDPNTIQLISKEMRHARIRAELREQARLPELSKHLDSAFKILNGDAQKYLFEEEAHALNKDLKEAENALDKIDLNSTSTNYKSFLDLKDSTIDSIFKIAVEKFNRLEYSESLSLFVLLATLIPENSDYWFRSGILASKCQNYELALRFYTAARSLDNTLIEPLVFSIECLIKQNMKEEAKHSISELENIIKDQSSGATKDWNEILSYYKLIVNN